MVNIEELQFKLHVMLAKEQISFEDFSLVNKMLEVWKIELKGDKKGDNIGISCRTQLSCLLIQNLLLCN